MPFQPHQKPPPGGFLDIKGGGLFKSFLKPQITFLKQIVGH